MAGSRVRVIEIEKEHYIRVYRGPKGTTFSFAVNGRLAKQGFTPTSVCYGPDFERAMKETREIWLPKLRAFIDGASAIEIEQLPAPDSVDKLVENYFERNAYKVLRPSTRRTYRRVLLAANNHIIRGGPFDGWRVGNLPVAKIDMSTASDIVDEYAIAIQVDPETGKNIEVARPSMPKKVRDTYRAVWNVMAGKLGMTSNPWEDVRSPKYIKKSKPNAEIEHLAAFRWHARDLGEPLFGDWIHVVWELKARVQDTLTKLTVDHYKPPGREDQIKVVHFKTGVQRWLNLYDEDGEQYYPALEARLDELKGNRTSGLLIPILNEEEASAIDLPTRVYKTFKAIMTRAGVDEEYTPATFRTGSITEGAEAGLSEAELQALTGHLDPRTLRAYIKNTRRLVRNAQSKTMDHRRKVLDALLRRRNLDPGIARELIDVMELLPRKAALAAAE
jgi:hypothetical protein